MLPSPPYLLHRRYRKHHKFYQPHCVYCLKELKTQRLSRLLTMNGRRRQIVQNQNIKLKYLHEGRDHSNGCNILDKKLNFSGLPPDVLYEIFRLLEPSDLLHLARATKSIRYVLLSRSAACIWKDSLARASNLPSYPEEMSPPSWAHLCFSSYCHTCFAEGTNNVNWELRIRACDSCLPSKIKPLPLGGCSFAWDCRWDNLISYFKKGRRLYCSKQDYDEVLQHIQSLESGGTALMEYIGSRVKLVYNRKRVASDCKKWYTKYLKEESKRKEIIRSQRLRFILRKLKELSWDFDIKDIFSSAMFIKDFKQQDLLCEPIVLTEESWKDIEAHIVEVVNQLEQKYLELARNKRLILCREILSQRYRDFCKQKFGLYYVNRLPHLEDVMEFPCFKEVINRSPKSIVAAVSSAEFDDAMSNLKALLIEWMKEKEILALSTIQSKVSDNFISLGIQIPRRLVDLRLAINMFYCNECQDAVDFRRLVRHQHTYKSHGEGSLLLQQSPWDLLCDAPYKGVPNFYYNPYVSYMAACIISMCSRDPATTTINDMDELNPWFECTICQREDGERFTARNWRLMINHQHDSCRLLDEYEMTQVRNFFNDNFDVDMWCTHCHNVIPFHDKSDHLRRKHQLDRPVKSEDYIRPTICSPIPSTCVTVYASLAEVIYQPDITYASQGFSF